MLDALAATFHNFFMTTWKRFVFTLVMASCSIAAARIPAGLVENKNGANRALLVGVPDDLPGIEFDLDILQNLVTLPAYGFQPSRIWKEEGTASHILSTIENVASAMDAAGTLLFYYSGHGDPGSIEVFDRSLEIEEIRDALISARKGKPALARLVLLFDSCFSGSLLPPWDASAQLAHQVATTFDKREKAWSKLMVFASSLSTEESDPTEEGSAFTLALARAYDEVAARKGNIGDWVSLTKRYTEGHQPIERLVPSSLATESLN